MGVSSEVTDLVAPDSTDLLSTHQSYIESGTYAMLVSRHELSEPELLDVVQSRQGEPRYDDRKFLEALHYFTLHTINWRALPCEFGKWNSV